jgi:hypothetical protein
MAALAEEVLAQAGGSEYFQTAGPASTISAASGICPERISRPAGAVALMIWLRVI